MPRGDRSRPERTTEQRERDREAREQRRGGRSPVSQPPPLPPAAEPLEHANELESFEPPPTEALEVLPDAPAPEPASAAPAPAPEDQPEHGREEFEAPAEAPGEAPGVAPGEAPAVAPGLAADEPEPEPSAPAAEGSRIGKPPPPISAGRRRRRATSRPSSRPPVRPPAGSDGHAHRARLGALVALLAALVAVVVAVVSLSSSGSSGNKVALPTVVNVLIPEGENRLQIAEIAKAKGLTGSYRRASERSPLLDPTKYGAPKGTPDLEGFLFPATYELDKGAPALRLVEDQLAAFTEHFGPPQIAAAKALHVTPYQLLTVASMIEREAQVPGDRAKIAAVIYNRLSQGIPLGIDATIYYAVELEKNIATYTHELTESQLHVNSPYNTRIHTGLPPTPISNPGAASIEAAAHPAKVPYLYYVAGADGCGEQVFSTSQEKFEADVAAYKAAVEKNGGHPPACTHK